MKRKNGLGNNGVKGSLKTIRASKNFNKLTQVKGSKFKAGPNSKIPLKESMNKLAEVISTQSNVFSSPTKPNLGKDEQQVNIKFQVSDSNFNFFLN